MIDLLNTENQIHYVTNFKELVTTPFYKEMNAICWNRKLIGDFSEIVNKVEFKGNMVELSKEELNALQLSEQGELARTILLNDLKVLKDYGASPNLNLINYYERDAIYPFFPADVYSFHVDRSPVPTDTFLCTYHGESSEMLPNSQAIQKIVVPEIRDELKKIYDGAEAGFKAFLSENFFDLHYQAKHKACPISFGTGHLWKIAVDHPESQAIPCVHRAPMEKNGQKRLLLIC